MVRPGVHEFHFVMGRRMKEGLMEVGMSEEKGGLSGIIVKILRAVGRVVEKEHSWGEDKVSKYMSVCEDKDEVREHVHVYLPGEVYKELKALHRDLNVYSIAQLVRGFLRFFLDMVEECGEGVYGVLAELFEKWKEEKNKVRWTNREVIRQLKLILHHLASKNLTIAVYNRRFSPFRIFRL